MPEETKTPEKTNKPRLRSPAHPIFDLETALQRAREFHDHEYGHWASPDTALGHWGFKVGNSKGLRYVAALKQFGLLEERGTKTGREVRISSGAKVLLLNPDQGSREWRQTVRESALSPKIYSDLWEEWGEDSELPSDDKIAYDLRMKWAFNRSAIDSFIRDFRATLGFAGLLRGDILEDEPEQDPNIAEDHGKTDQSPKTARVPMQPLTIPLRPDGTTAILNAPNPLTMRDVANLQAWLTWYKTSMVDESPNPMSSAGQTDDAEPDGTGDDE